MINEEKLLDAIAALRTRIAVLEQAVISQQKLTREQYEGLVEELTPEVRKKFVC